MFFYSKKSINRELFKYRTTNHFWMFIRFYGYNEEVFYFWCPRENFNSFSPIPEDDEELSLPELIYWASLGDLEQVKQLLIDREDPNQTDDEGYTALQAAAENDHLEIVKLLVEKGAHVTYKSEYTALQLAEMAGNTDIVNYLKSL
ncbi:ankyrin repeat domain-containing protein [Acinetobacter baumannii]|nr:ankyrin repeat domain-containing protein [Acinetobacter baumannii]